MAEPPKPIPVKSATENASYGVRLGDLKNLKKNVRTQIESSVEIQCKEITKENLQEAWIEVAEKMTAQKMIYRSAVMLTELEFANHEITLLTDIVALDYLKGERITLLEHFKTYYKNQEINVLFKEKPKDENATAGRVLSTKEVFEKMALKNPLLKNLKDGLAMDFDY